jgi:hypothetical protein
MTNPKLALIPSGYKGGANPTVYSILPSDGSGDFTYERNGNATRVRKDGLIEELTVDDTPRLDWLNSNCPSLLLEAERTNDTTYSEDYTQTSYWGNVIDVVATKDEAVAPDGNFTANKIQANSGTNFKILRTNAFTIPSGVTMSMFVKKGNHDYIIFKAQGDYEFNLSTLQFNQSYSNVGYEDYGNGWIRLYATTSSSVLSYFGIYLTDSSFNQSWNANGNEFVYVWGAQYEVGDYMSSYIKSNSGSTTTRLKDECINAGDSDLFDITEGTFFVDANNFGTPLNNFSMITLSDGSNNFVRFIYESSRIRTSVENGSIQQDYFITGVNDNERNKVAITFKENEFKTYLNGVLKDTDTSGVVPTGFDRINFAGTSGTNRHFEGKVYDTRVYDRVLTEAEAIELTTL